MWITKTQASVGAKKTEILIFSSKLDILDSVFFVRFVMSSSFYAAHRYIFARPYFWELRLLMRCFPGKVFQANQNWGLCSNLRCKNIRKKNLAYYVLGHYSNDSSSTLSTFVTQSFDRFVSWLEWGRQGIQLKHGTFFTNWSISSRPLGMSYMVFRDTIS